MIIMHRYMVACFCSLFINMLIGKVTSTEGTALEESHVDTSPRSIFDDLPEKLVCIKYPVGPS